MFEVYLLTCLYVSVSVCYNYRSMLITTHDFCPTVYLAQLHNKFPCPSAIDSLYHRATSLYKSEPLLKDFLVATLHHWGVMSWNSIPMNINMSQFQKETWLNDNVIITAKRHCDVDFWCTKKLLTLLSRHTSTELVIYQLITYVLFNYCKMNPDSQYYLKF